MSKSQGFTLIELMVVMAIVGALIGTALPHYTAYRQRAFDMRALSDLRMVALAEEAYFLDFENYQSCSGSSCSILPGVKVLSKGVTLAITATSSSFTGSSTHPQGSGKIYQWDSDQGGLTN